MRKVHPMTGLEAHQALPVRTGGVTGRVGSFGYTRVDRDRVRRFHGGVDWPGDMGQPIFASHDGTIARAGYQTDENGREVNRGYGQRIYLQTFLPRGEKLRTIYAHLSAQLHPVGRAVYAGELLGWLGQSGNAWNTPPHLHFEVWLNNQRKNPEWWLHGSPHLEDGIGPEDLA